MLERGPSGPSEACLRRFRLSNNLGCQCWTHEVQTVQITARKERTLSFYCPRRKTAVQTKRGSFSSRNSRPRVSMNADADAAAVGARDPGKAGKQADKREAEGSRVRGWMRWLNG